MYHTAQFKIRFVDDTAPWEDLPIAHIQSFNRAHLTIDGNLDYRAEDQANCILDIMSEAVEVRWNWIGSSQGHYACSVSTILREA